MPKKSYKTIFKRTFTSQNVTLTFFLPWLIPVLLIAMFIKTIIDYFTRKNVPEEIFNDAVEKLEKSATPEQLDSLTAELSKTRPASKSSLTLLSKLKLIPQEVSAEFKREKEAAAKEIQTKREVKRREIQRAQYKAKYPETADILAQNGYDYLSNAEIVDAKSDRELNSFTAELITKNNAEMALKESNIKGEILKRRKQELLGFIKAEHNPGKRTMRGVCYFFAKQKVSIDAPTVNAGVKASI